MLEEVEAQFGTRDFVGVHARVEGDWEQQCRAAQNRTDPSTMLFSNKHQCWVRCLPRSSWPQFSGSFSCACIWVAWTGVIVGQNSTHTLRAGSKACRTGILRFKCARSCHAQCCALLRAVGAIAISRPV